MKNDFEPLKKPVEYVVVCKDILNWNNLTAQDILFSFAKEQDKEKNQIELLQNGDVMWTKEAYFAVRKNNTVFIDSKIFIEKNKTVYTNTCYICLENIKEEEYIMRTNCQHMYHKDCKLDLISKKIIDCPLCKRVYCSNNIDNIVTDKYKKITIGKYHFINKYLAEMLGLSNMSLVECENISIIHDLNSNPYFFFKQGSFLGDPKNFINNGYGKLQYRSTFNSDASLKDGDIYAGIFKETLPDGKGRLLKPKTTHFKLLGYEGNFKKGALDDKQTTTIFYTD